MNRQEKKREGAMPSFKEMKKAARGSVKKHYVVFVAILIIVTVLCEGRSLTRSFTGFYNDQNASSSKINSKSYTVKSDTAAQSAAGKVLDQLANNKTDKADEIVQEEQDKTKNAVPEAGLGGTEGVASGVIGTLTSGSLLVTISNALAKVFKNGSVGNFIVVFLVLLIYFAFFMFIRNIADAVQSRVYLESRIYDKTPFSRIFFFMRNRKWRKVAWTMLVKYVYQVLWLLTIVGGIIKYFSYLMVPYIIAENPDLKANEAITLSRKMMKGHKWEACKLGLSFIGWFLLSIVTFGILEVFFVIPYLDATFAEYYAHLRRISKENGVEGAEVLNDEYLYAKADRSLLEDTYADVIAREEKAEAKEEVVQLNKAQTFFAKYLGIWIGSTEMRNHYQERENLEFKIGQHKQRLEGEAYPTRLAPAYYIRPEKKKKKKKEKSDSYNWLRVYTVWNVLALFIIFCFVGWAWEVFLHIIRDGEFVNRGTLHGPWLPIYGAGGALIIVLLSAFRKNPVAEVVLTVVVCGLVEYLSAKIIEDGSMTRYWNYKGYFLNLDGRICFEGMLIFAVMGMVAVYLAAPALDNLLSKIPVKIFAPIVSVIMVLFIADAIYSHFYPNGGAGISEDLCIGGWPETLSMEDKLDLSEKDAAQLRENTEDVRELVKAGVPVSNLDQLELARENGLMEAVKNGTYSYIVFTPQLQEIRELE